MLLMNSRCFALCLNNLKTTLYVRDWRWISFLIDQKFLRFLKFLSFITEFSQSFCRNSPVMDGQLRFISSHTDSMMCFTCVQLVVKGWLKDIVSWMLFTMPFSWLDYWHLSLIHIDTTLRILNKNFFRRSRECLIPCLFWFVHFH